ncbi:cytochrome c-type biogenesis protein [Corynebacterium aquatimens]|uniref:Cytochrome c-type biogenesis protein n=2 Tax=Corynebacterium aquatimens TaxID=1190508 RepID=A0A931E1Y7_9CORY|nr:cytochrome c-type biogenesis protein [Corynebacterium aquatimens]
MGIFAAALAGLVSFASPCVIPLVPGYLAYLTSIVGGERRRMAVVGAAAAFVAGFTVVFLLATVTVFGAISLIALNAETLMRIGGVVTIIMGLVFMGAFPALQTDTRMQPKRWATWIGAPLLGGVFALGWTPCLSPTLGAIISLSVGTEGFTALRGILLVMGYCIGLGLPFLLLAWGSSWAVGGMEFLRRHSRTIQVIGGITMVILGILLLTGAWNHFIGWTRQLVMGFGMAV